MTEISGPVSNNLIAEQLSPLTDVAVHSQKHKRFRISKTKALYFGEYTLGQNLGWGRLGEVRLAYSPTSVPVAIKLIPRYILSGESLQKIALALQVMNDLEHPNAMIVNSIVVDGELIGFVMDLAAKGDVHHYLAENGKVGEDTAKRWFAQLVSVVDEMHTQSYVHRDIKPENLLLDDEDNILLTDFEMCASFRRQGFPYAKRVCGTPTFCCPEAMLSTAEYNLCKGDIWSMGVTLFVMVAGYRPFDDNLYRAQTKEELVELYDHIQSTPLELPDFLSSDLVDLLQGLLAKDPSERMSMVDVKKHPWLEEHNNMWLNPETFTYPQRRSRRTSRFGSLSSTSSLQTLNDRLAECTKQVRGPIIWDPDAGCSPY